MVAVSRILLRIKLSNFRHIVLLHKLYPSRRPSCPMCFSILWMATYVSYYDQLTSLLLLLSLFNVPSSPGTSHHGHCLIPFNLVSLFDSNVCLLVSLSVSREHINFHHALCIFTLASRQLSNCIFENKQNYCCRLH